jgi:hypothetical protein
MTVFTIRFGETPIPVQEKVLHCQDLGVLEFLLAKSAKTDNADHNATLNNLTAGQRSRRLWNGKVQAPVMKQEPVYGAPLRTRPIGIPSL